MKSIVLLACFLVVAFAAPWTEDNFVLKFKPQETQDLDQTVHDMWEDFKNVHGKSYKSKEEEALRKGAFAENLKKIEMHNYLYSKGLKSYTMGVNEYADLKGTEFAAIMNGLKPRTNITLAKIDRLEYLSPAMPVEVPDKVDWRDHGYVTPVKNQGSCGSCWAFSTIGSLEGQHFRKTGKLVSLSEQNLVDCATTTGNHGCDGGRIDSAFEYIKENDGIDTEDSYPYEGIDGQCHYKAKFRGATDKGFIYFPHGDEDKLKEGVATTGPISVQIDSNHDSFHLYKTGVWDEPKCNNQQLDHGVLVVGYGTTEEGIDYWLVKNSWGETWGDEGYIKMVRNKDNQCGVATWPLYPLV